MMQPATSGKKKQSKEEKAETFEVFAFFIKKFDNFLTSSGKKTPDVVCYH